MSTKARHLAGLVRSGAEVCGLSRRLLQHGVEHLHDEALLRLGQCGDALDLPLQLRHRPALGGLGLFADQFLDADAEQRGQSRQVRDRHATLAAFVGGDGLLRDAELFGELNLRDALLFAQAGDACAELEQGETGSGSLSGSQMQGWPGPGR